MAEPASPAASVSSKSKDGGSTNPSVMSPQNSVEAAFKPQHHRSSLSMVPLTASSSATTPNGTSSSSSSTATPRIASAGASSSNYPPLPRKSSERSEESVASSTQGDISSSVSLVSHPRSPLETPRLAPSSTLAAPPLGALTQQLAFREGLSPRSSLDTLSKPTIANVGSGMVDPTSVDLDELLNVRVSYSHSKLTGLLQQILLRLSKNEDVTRSLSTRMSGGYADLQKEIHQVTNDNDSIKTRFTSLQQDVASLRARLDSSMNSALTLINRVQADGKKDRDRGGRGSVVGSTGNGTARGSGSSSSSNGVNGSGSSSGLTLEDGSEIPYDWSEAERRMESMEKDITEMRMQLETMTGLVAAGDAERNQLRERAELAEARMHELQRHITSINTMTTETRDELQRGTAEREGQHIAIEEMRMVMNSVKSQIDFLGGTVNKLGASGMMGKEGKIDGAEVMNSIKTLRSEVETVRERDRERDAQWKGTMEGELRAGMERISRLEALQAGTEERVDTVSEALTETKRDNHQNMLRTVCYLYIYISIYLYVHV